MTSAERFDIVVFGATGFTGQYVVEEVARVASENPGLTWAIAGRNETKLKAVLTEATLQTGIDVNSVATIIADVGDADSLVKMAKRTRLVLNCVGPFLEKMELDYSAKAKENKVYVVGACGFDSIPCEMGVQYLQQNFEGELNAVESNIITKPGKKGTKAHTGTLHSILHGIANARDLKPLRTKLYPKPLPKNKYPLVKRGMLSYNNDIQSWSVPFPGSDKSVVYRTQRFNYEHRRMRPILLEPYFQFTSVIHALAVFYIGVVIFIMSKFTWTQNLVKAYPGLFTLGVFSEEGATREQIKEAKASMTFIGYGFPEKLKEPEDQHTSPPSKKMIVRLDMPEIGYDLTSQCMVQAGLTILKETDKLPESGGVYTAGAAFLRTSLLERLQKRCLTFSVVQN
jgi:short subunit dehydrogenase-like uncharacterized protein